MRRFLSQLFETQLGVYFFIAVVTFFIMFILFLIF